MSIKADYEWAAGAVREAFHGKGIQVFIGQKARVVSGPDFECRMKNLVRYILHIAMGYGFKEIAVAEGCNRRSVYIGIGKVEDARDLPDLDRALDEIELAALERIREAA